MAHQVAADAPDSHERDEIPERHGRAERPDRNGVTEHRSRIAHPFEPTTRPEIGVGQVLGVDGTGVDQGAGTHRHRTVGEDRACVERQSDGEHPHADEVAVEERERGEQGQRPTEQQSLRPHVDERHHGLQPDARHQHSDGAESRAGQVTAERSSQRPDRGAHDGGSDDGDHRSRR